MIPVGIWNFNDINNKIKSILTQNGDSAENITISVDKNEYRTILTLTGSYMVNFNIPNSINVLGFEKTRYRGTHKSPNIPDIASTQLYFIVINLIKPNILRKDGEAKSTKCESYQAISKECWRGCHYPG